MFIQVSVHNADMWNHTSIDVSLRTILLYKDIYLIKKDSDVRKEMIKNTFRNSESDRCNRGGRRKLSAGTAKERC